MRGEQNVFKRPSMLEDEQAVARREGLEARIIARTTTQADVDWLVESLEVLAAERDSLREFIADFVGAARRDHRIA